MSVEEADAVLSGVIEVSCCMRCGEMFNVSSKQRVRHKNGGTKSVPLCDVHMPFLVPGDTLKLTYEFEAS